MAGDLVEGFGLLSGLGIGLFALAVEWLHSLDHEYQAHRASMRELAKRAVTPSLGNAPWVDRLHTQQGTVIIDVDQIQIPDPRKRTSTPIPGKPNASLGQWSQVRRWPDTARDRLPLRVGTRLGMYIRLLKEMLVERESHREALVSKHLARESFEVRIEATGAMRKGTVEDLDRMFARSAFGHNALSALQCVRLAWYGRALSAFGATLGVVGALIAIGALLAGL